MNDPLQKKSRKRDLRRQKKNRGTIVGRLNWQFYDVFEDAQNVVVQTFTTQALRESIPATQLPLLRRVGATNLQILLAHAFAALYFSPRLPG